MNELISLVVVGSLSWLTACSATCEKACNNISAVCGGEYAIAGVKFDFKRCVSLEAVIAQRS